MGQPRGDAKRQNRGASGPRGRTLGKSAEMHSSEWYRNFRDLDVQYSIVMLPADAVERGRGSLQPEGRKEGRGIYGLHPPGPAQILRRTQ